jgi:hypothetical protein
MKKFPITSHKPPFLRLLYISLLINVASIIGIILVKNILPPELPLFYGLPEGEEQLTKTLGLAIAPAISLSIVLINSAIAYLQVDEFLKKTLIVAGFCVSIFSLVTTIQIVLLVGNIGR